MATDPADAELERERAEARRVLAVATIKFMASFSGKVLIGTLCVFAGVCLLRVLNVIKDTGSAADWVAAGAATFAAVIALGLATKDRRERVSERNEADHAQMRLIQLGVAGHNDADTPAFNFVVSVTNHGSRPILDAQIQDAHLWTGADFEAGNAVEESFYRLRDPGPVPPILPVIAHVEQQLHLTPGVPSRQFLICVADASGNLWRPERDGIPFFDVRLSCIDADGNQWIVSNQQEPVKHTVPQGPSAWQTIRKHHRYIATELWRLYGPNRRVAQWIRRTAFAAVVVLLLVLVCSDWQRMLNLLSSGLLQ